MDSNQLDTDKFDMNLDHDEYGSDLDQDDPEEVHHCTMGCMFCLDMSWKDFA